MIKNIRFVIKQVSPYGIMLVWLKSRYSMEIDKPLMYYPGFMKRVRRVVKFLLPFGLVMRVKRTDQFQLEKAKTTILPPLLTNRTPLAHLGLLKQRALIIAELSIPQCTYYRVSQKVEMLCKAGVVVEVDTWTDYYSCLCRMQFATVVIFYRTPYTKEVAKLYEEARRLGLRVGFDIDDLVFDVEEYSKNSNLKSLCDVERRNLLEGALLYQQSLAAADFSIASTRKLQAFMKKYCKGPSYIISNCVCQSKNVNKKAFPLGLDGKLVIGYGSGTSTHNQDFKLCADAVVRILQEFPNVVFVLHGTLELPTSFDVVKDRVIRVEFVPFEDYSQAISRFDINLIPLESGVFNDCKSNIKYLEASLMGVPSVASPLAEFRFVIRDGVTGFLADSPDSWYRTLKRLVKSKELRNRIGSRAKKLVLDRYDSGVILKRALLPMIRDESQIYMRQKKRILLVNVLFPPTSFGGATVLCENLVSEYLKTSDVCVFTMSMNVYNYSGHVTRYDYRGAMCFQIENFQTGSNNWDVEDVLPAFEKVVNSFGPDLVHFNSIQFLGLQLVEFCKRSGIPYIVTAHDAWWICERQFMLNDKDKFCAQDKLGIDLYKCAQCTKSRTLFSRWARMHSALLGARLVLTPSDYQASLYIKSGLPKELVHTNRNGILTPASVLPHQNGGILRFAYLGGKCEHKGYFFLKDIMKDIKGEYLLKLVDINLKFGQKTIDANEWPDPDKVECCPPFEVNGMNDFYSGIDVLLFPSCLKESFGLTVREALARNVWVIATDAGGDIANDLKDGENGNLVKLGDARSFRAAIQSLIYNPERLSGYVNPYRMKITTVEQQVSELMKMINRYVDCA